MTTTPNPVRVRYAPSPTGDFHVGGARTALFNYLFARHHGGQFILRIEDTDQTRYNPEAMGWLVNGLRYLGLQWDEGYEVGGEYGPYIQTERLDIYQKYCLEIIERGHAYTCFCSSERLESVREAQAKNKVTQGYDRHCRDLNPAESAKRAANGEPCVVRAKIPLAGEITFHDVIKGEITYQWAAIQDAVLMKSDGIPTYHFANVVDDHLMHISHIMRGDEWINSVPLHLFLYQAFDWQPPIMAHLPLILNPTGKGKMSKREDRAPDGKLMPVFVRTFQEMGYLTEAITNYLALLGWSYDDKTEIMTREELIERFSLERVKPSAAAWNYDKLDHFNGDYIRRLSVEDLTARLVPFLNKVGVPATYETLLPITPLVQERIKTLTEAADFVDFFFVGRTIDSQTILEGAREAVSKPNPQAILEGAKKAVEISYDIKLLIPKNIDVTTVREILTQAQYIFDTTDFELTALDTALRAAAKSLSLKPGIMFQPIRVAVCGKMVAPPLFETLIIIGRETVMKRLGQAIAKLN